MTQDDIIYNIINTFNIKVYNTSYKQKSVQYPLGEYAMKRPTWYQDQWNYSSVIIILMYATSNSCQNIEFYVHQ